MAFATWGKGTEMYDATPIDNLFITEHMLHAPGNYVKVYIYTLMLCYHPNERMGISAMAHDLEMEEKEVTDAFKYWTRQGLARQTGDNPVTFEMISPKQLFVEKASNPGEQLYNSRFTEEVNRILDPQIPTYTDMEKVYEWIDIFEFSEEVVIGLLQSEKKRSTNGRVSFAIADRKAREWAQRGVHNVEDLEKLVDIDAQREKELQKLLARLGQRRPASDDEKALYNKWIEEWNLSPEVISESCSETVKGVPTMAYLDGILKRRHQMGIESMSDLKANEASQGGIRQLTKELLRILGRAGTIPSEEDLEMVQGWLKDGNEEEYIRMAARRVHALSNGGNLEMVGDRIRSWREQGMFTREQVDAAANAISAQKKHIRELLKKAGVDKRGFGELETQTIMRWTDMQMGDALIAKAAEYAAGSGKTIASMDKILKEWKEKGIVNVAQAEEEHLQKFNRRSDYYDREDRKMHMLQHTDEERRETYTPGIVDLTKEDDD